MVSSAVLLKQVSQVNWPALVCLLAIPGLVRASDDFLVPPPPEELPSRWVLEVHLDALTPLDVDGLCPTGAACVYSGGAGVGATAERRRPTGFGFFVGYDGWFIGSSSVYELAVQSTVRGGVRYTWPNASMVHPVFELGAGLTGFGDTFVMESVGVALQGMAALEVELTHHFGLQGGVGIRAFSHSRFTTSRDGVRRGRGEVFSETLFLQLGLTIHGRPWAAAEP